MFNKQAIRIVRTRSWKKGTCLRNKSNTHTVHDARTPNTLPDRVQRIRKICQVLRNNINRSCCKYNWLLKLNKPPLVNANRPERIEPKTEGQVEYKVAFKHPLTTSQLSTYMASCMFVLRLLEHAITCQHNRQNLCSRRESLSLSPPFSRGQAPSRKNNATSFESYNIVCSRAEISCACAANSEQHGRCHPLE